MVNELFMVVKVGHSFPTATLMQNVTISDLIERISSGTLLIPSVEGLSRSGEARILPEMSDLELSTLVINSNRLAAVYQGHSFPIASALHLNTIAVS